MQITVQSPQGLGELVGVRHRPWGDFYIFRIDDRGHVWVKVAREGIDCRVRVDDHVPELPKRIFVEDVEIIQKRGQIIKLPPSLRTWPDILAFNQTRLNTPPILDVGEEKVTVGIPWGPGKMYVAKRFFNNLAALKLPTETTLIFDLVKRPGTAKQERVVASHNVLKQEALDNGSDYFMLIEADNLPPPDAYLRLKTLIEEHEADVANVPYSVHIGPQGPILDPYAEWYDAFCWRGEYYGLYAVNFKDLLTAPYPFQVTSAGFGCTLFTPKAIGKKPWFASDVWCSDGTFALRVVEENLKFLVDNRVLCQHLCCPACYQRVYGESKPIDVLKTIQKLFKHRDYKIIEE